MTITKTNKEMNVSTRFGIFAYPNFDFSKNQLSGFNRIANLWGLVNS